MEFGYLYVKTDRPYYYAGNTVYGKIYIRVNSCLEAKCLEIKLKGKMKNSFITGSGDDRHKVKGKRRIMMF